MELWRAETLSCIPGIAVRRKVHLFQTLDVGFREKSHK